MLLLSIYVFYFNVNYIYLASCQVEINVYNLYVPCTLSNLVFLHKLYISFITSCEKKLVNVYKLYTVPEALHFTGSSTLYLQHTLLVALHSTCSSTLYLQLYTVPATLHCTCSTTLYLLYSIITALYCSQYALVQCSPALQPIRATLQCSPALQPMGATFQCSPALQPIGATLQCSLHCSQ